MSSPAFPDRMVCPRCEESGAKSSVWLGAAIRGATYGAAHWGEDGEVVPSVSTFEHVQFFSCSRGHEFRMVSTNGGAWRSPAESRRLSLGAGQ